MKHKGYSAAVEFDEDSGVLFGRVIGLRDVITFQGSSVAEVTQAFHDSVDDYLEFCAERGEDPEKPYSGHFVVRIQPELHRALANSAEANSVSLNSLVESALARMFPATHGKATVEPTSTTAASVGRGAKKPLAPSKGKALKKRRKR
jgi:predicted HicB family RNase H-like nuclease